MSRIRKNTGITDADVMAWCRTEILSPDASCERSAGTGTFMRSMRPVLP
ncbi:hypothetical protein [Ruminobacter sp. RM87]